MMVSVHYFSAMQHVIGIIKPHAIRHRHSIIQKLQDGGFRKVSERCVEIGIDEAWYLSKDENGIIPSDATLVENKIQSLLGTALILLLDHKNAFEAAQKVLGPDDPVEARKTSEDSIRAAYGELSPYNAIVISESPALAVRETHHFFPRFSDTLRGPLSDLTVPDERIEIDTYFREKMLPTLLDAFYDLCVKKPAEAVEHLSAYLLQNNPTRPKIVNPK